ncbi:MAG TPA: cytochrome P450 [Candidatus Binataceae bacterium]|nr:cytochrome P450 [Candidatus Binataceae bacterium]
MPAEDAPQIYFNPWDETFRANPYPHYRALYGRPPYRLNLFVPMALVGRYRDAAAILRDHERFSSVPPMSPFIQERLEVFGSAPRVVFSDPPVHTRLRRLVSRAFTPRRIRDLEPRIHQIADMLLDRVAASGSFEVMGDLANPLPVMVIAEILGVPHEDYLMFKQLSDQVIESDNTLPGSPLPEAVKAAFRSLREYFINEIEKRRCSPGQDLVSALVASRDEADALTEEELITFVVLLLLAGNETTTNLIGNGMLALARNPEQMQKLIREPDLMPRAIEEMLRYDCPVQSTARYPRIDVTIDEVNLTANTVTFVMVAAANRDPEQFPNPDSFDISREPNEHLAFGEGIHYCLGAPLARMEGAIAIEAALSRFPRLRLLNSDQQFAYKGSYFLRGLASLPMAID